MRTEKDYYLILGIPRHASYEEVRKAYRTYATKFHPDKHQGDVFFEERFKEVREAYDTLSDDMKRVRYDMERFGRSKISRKMEFEPEKPGMDDHETSGFKLHLTLPHPELYISLFYFLNVAGWVAARRVHEGSSMTGNIWSFFCCCVSALLVWRFVTGIVEWRANRLSLNKGLLFVMLFIAIAVVLVPVVPGWIP